MGREDELAMLDSAWLDAKTNIVEFVAFGGVGKSALVAEWLKRIQADQYRGAARVFGHSFYSQGSREDAQASADSFLDQALRFFGDPDPTEGSPWDKGERLARLVRQQPTLLILDGVEPLQSPETTDDAGQVRDPGLQALIVELASSLTLRVERPRDSARLGESSYEGGGLTVISTRAQIKDLEGRRDSSVVSHSLDYLSVGAGTVLLREIGVTGTDEELGLAVKEVGGHALSVTLLAKYLVMAEAGDINRRFEIGLPSVHLVPANVDEAEQETPDNDLDVAVTPDVTAIEKTVVGDPEKKRKRDFVSKTFSRIMQRYEVWLSGLQDREGDVEVSGRLALEIARLTGLFDRPITAGEFAALVGEVQSQESRDESRKTAEALAPRPSTLVSAIPGLTDLASAASEGEVNLAIGRLVEYGLITKVTTLRIRLSVPAWPDPASSEVVLDAHPLIREYFARRLAEGGRGGDEEMGREGDQSIDSPHLSSPSLREANRRLYEHLKQSAPERPDNLNDMMPLYHAVAHGCKAGLHTSALELIYKPRIHRGSEFFATRELGAFAVDLQALLLLRGGAADLNRGDVAFLDHMIASRLRALGCPHESITPLKHSLELADVDSDSINAAIRARHLSEVYLLLNRVELAVEIARKAVVYAEVCSDTREHVIELCVLGNALSESTEFDQAQAAFDSAIQIQCSIEPNGPFLYSLWGYMYCDHLLRQGKDVLAKGYAEKVLSSSRQEQNHIRLGLLDVPMMKLALAKAIFQNGSPATDHELMELVCDVVNGLRKAGYQEDLARGLILKAQVCHRAGDVNGRDSSFDEACVIAKRGQMKLHLNVLDTFEADVANDNRCAVSGPPDDALDH